MKEIVIETREKYEIVDVTERVLDNLEISDGIVFLYVPHTTACITINESEEGIFLDLKNFFRKLIKGMEFEHDKDKFESNGDAHVISSMIGNSRFFFVRNGRPLFGTWQRILFIELDGPRRRKLII